MQLLDALYTQDSLLMFLVKKITKACENIHCGHLFGKDFKMGIGL